MDATPVNDLALPADNDLLQLLFATLDEQGWAVVCTIAPIGWWCSSCARTCLAKVNIAG